MLFGQVTEATVGGEMVRMALFSLLTLVVMSLSSGCASTQQRSLTDELNDLKGQDIQAVRNYRLPMETAYDANTGDHYVWRQVDMGDQPSGIYYFIWRIRPIDIGNKDVDYVRVSTDSKGRVVDFEFLDELPLGKAK